MVWFLNFTNSILIVTQLVKKFPPFYRTQRFITTFTIAWQWSLSWAWSHIPTPIPWDPFQYHPLLKLCYFVTVSTRNMNEIQNEKAAVKVCVLLVKLCVSVTQCFTHVQLVLQLLPHPLENIWSYFKLHLWLCDSNDLSWFSLNTTCLMLSHI
jgi:hypothetical protein